MTTKTTNSMATGAREPQPVFLDQPPCVFLYTIFLQFLCSTPTRDTKASSNLIYRTLFSCCRFSSHCRDSRLSAQSSLCKTFFFEAHHKPTFTITRTTHRDISTLPTGIKTKTKAHLSTIPRDHKLGKNCRWYQCRLNFICR